MVKAHWLRNHSSLPPSLVLLLPPFLSSLPPSILLLLLSFRHWCTILWLPPSQPVVLRQQPRYSLRTTCRHDPKHTPRSQTGASHTHHSSSSKGITHDRTGWGGGGGYAASVDRRAEVSREGSLWPPEKHCRRNNKERGMERRENIERRREKNKNDVIKAERVHVLFP